MVALFGWFLLLSGAFAGPQPNPEYSTSTFLGQVKNLLSESRIPILSGSPIPTSLNDAVVPYIERISNRILTEINEQNESSPSVDAITFPDVGPGPIDVNGSSFIEEISPRISGGPNVNARAFVPLLGPSPLDTTDMFTGPVGKNPEWSKTVGSLLASKIGGLRDMCGCVGHADCGCCVGTALKPIAIRQNVCVNVSTTNDIRSSSEFMIHTKVFYEKYKVLDISVSEKEPPTVCLNVIPMFNFLHVCMQLDEVNYDEEYSMICTCVKFSVHIAEKTAPTFMFSPKCWCIGKPVPEHKKRGIIESVIDKTLSDLSPLAGLRNLIANNYLGK